MERPSGYLFTPGIEEDRRATQHLLRGFSSECEKENMLRLDSKFDEVRDAIDDCARLPCSRPGDDKMRPVHRRDRIVLGRVQLVLIVDIEPSRMNEMKLSRGSFDCKLFHLTSEKNLRVFHLNCNPARSGQFSIDTDNDFL